MTRSLAILGCGWLGERIGKAFLEKGWKVNASSRNEKRLEELKGLGFLPFQIDIEETKTIAPNFFDVDVLIIAITNKNKFAHQNILKIIEQSRVEGIFFISSTSVYEKTEEQPTIDSPVDTSPLVEIENIYLTDNKSCILRCGGLIGDNRQPGNFFKKGATIKNPEAVVNLVHYKEIIAKINSLLTNGIEKRVYNLIRESQESRFSFYSKAYEELHGENGKFKLTLVGAESCRTEN